MRSALIGYTGFIGSNLTKHHNFTDFYNSENIDKIEKNKFDLIVNAAPYSLRWKADLEPRSDWNIINNLINRLKNTETKLFILISTVDVYPTPVNVNEDTKIAENRPDGYGLNRFRFENFVRQNFKNHICIRLPQTFGSGIKKNFIFDLINNNVLDFTHKESNFQWYNLKNLWKDISTAIENKFSIVNFAVEPISAHEVAKYTLGMDFKTETDKPPLNYDMHTKYAKFFNSRGDYIYYKNAVLGELKKFIQTEKNKL